MKMMKMIKNKLGDFFEKHYGIALTLVGTLSILVILVFGCICNNPYSSTAFIISIGNEGAVVEYRDRRNILRQDFVELTESHNEGDVITIRVDGWKSSKKEVDK